MGCFNGLMVMASFTDMLEEGGHPYADEIHEKLCKRIDEWVKKLDLEGLAKDMEVHEEIELHEGLKLVRDY